MGRGGGSFGVGAILRIWGENVVRGIGKGEGGGGVGGKGDENWNQIDFVANGEIAMDLRDLWNQK